MAVYGYCRVSTTAQANDGESLEVQQRKVEGRALQDGVKIARFFIERGVSGARPLEERPEGKKLLAVLKPGDVVIASKLDRMFRSASDALRVLERLKKGRVSLVLLDLGGDVTGDGIARLVFTILSAVAAFERERIGERIRDVKREQQKDGRYLGGSRPFGYRIGAEGELEEVPEEQRAVRLMRKLKERGQSLRGIAEEVSRRTGLRVSHVTVARCLSQDAA